MKSKTLSTIGVAGIFLLAGILLAIPGGTEYQTAAADDTDPTLTMTASPTATGTPAATLTPVFTATTVATRSEYVYLPYIRGFGTPPPTPTPTFTPTPLPVQFAGHTNQGQTATLVAAGDFSAVVQLQIPVTVVCDGHAFSYLGQISLPGGLPIFDHRFSLRLLAGWLDPETPVYDEYAGEFDPAFSTVQGTWRKWNTPNEPICDNTGTWSVSRQP